MSPWNVWHLSLREIRSAYTTVVGWLVLFGWLFLSGVFWYFSVFAYVEASQDLVYDPYRAAQLQLTTWLFAPYFGNCAVVLLMFAPMLSMRVFSEELRNRTLELLLTSPVSTADIVLGKYLGLLWNVVVLLGVSSVYPLMLLQWAKPDAGALAAGYLGLLLLGSSIVSLGMWVSSFTANQIVAAGGTFSLALALFVADFGSQGDPDAWTSQVAILSHLSDLLRGEVRLSDLVYYLAFTGLCLFGTHQRVESFRWR
jgi:ABC-2 type transport system permease protein